MKHLKENIKEEVDDIKKVREFLLNLGFVCNSYPSAQHLIYTKAGEIVIIKNHKK